MKRFGKVSLCLTIGGFFCVNKRIPQKMATTLHSVFSGLLKLNNESRIRRSCQIFTNISHSNENVNREQFRFEALICTVETAFVTSLTIGGTAHGLLLAALFILVIQKEYEELNFNYLDAEWVSRHSSICNLPFGTGTKA
ncbi:uncharacterized protein LOC111614373 [Centruroides sculpturatus]|uniref:uncharacterized protein LOC111614373 n=1 Tax=Centruroides sculpturatus TaxID=218467 RepID=UPI000C6CD755|nr:uncharacterized protein LOC111614373 [Centruroides sculpturatus]